ncbi:IclR family transcriptional regulator [Ramlibacter sp.]|uniref:IclR family transcriptional regulator n=1 Tax=Ramlibacter sp. TaxID=1917967 RepID=UPI00179EA7A7|nr:IclR family transcriptional regulator [Ramlibacter sp.]MBA2672748.1 IclR family transcriptional regulator [Ramlibacter sp.]
MKSRKTDVQQARSASVKSASRTLDLLECLAKSSQPMSHSDIAWRTSIPKSSLTQLLRTLQSRDYVESMGEGGPFRLGSAAHQLIAFGLDVQRLIACAQPAMQDLADATSQSCALNLLKGDLVERVHRIKGASGLPLHDGVRAPLYASSAGKLFLARLSSAELESYFERVELLPLARRSIRSLGELHRQISSARLEGIAYSQDEFTDGVVGLSAPVVDGGGQMLAAIGLAVPTAEFAARRAMLTKALQSAAKSASSVVAEIPDAQGR